MAAVLAPRPRHASSCSSFQDVVVVGEEDAYDAYDVYDAYCDGYDDGECDVVVDDHDKAARHPPQSPPTDFPAAQSPPLRHKISDSRITTHALEARHPPTPPATSPPQSLKTSESSSSSSPLSAKPAPQLLLSPSNNLVPEKPQAAPPAVNASTSSPLRPIMATGVNSDRMGPAPSTVAAYNANAIDNLAASINISAPTFIRSQNTTQKHPLSSKPKYFGSVPVDHETEAKRVSKSAQSKTRNSNNSNYSIMSEHARTPLHPSHTAHHQDERHSVNDQQSATPYSVTPSISSLSSFTSASHRSHHTSQGSMHILSPPDRATPITSQSIYQDIIKAKIRQIQQEKEQEQVAHHRHISQNKNAITANASDPVHTTNPNPTLTNNNFAYAHQSQASTHLFGQSSGWTRLVLPAIRSNASQPKNIVFHIPPPPKVPPPLFLLKQVYQQQQMLCQTNTLRSPASPSCRILSDDPSAPYVPHGSIPTSPYVNPYIPSRPQTPPRGRGADASALRLSSLGVFDLEPKTRSASILQPVPEITNVNLNSFETPNHVRVQKVQKVGTITGPQLVSTSSRMRTIPIEVIKRDLVASGRWTSDSDHHNEVRANGVESDPTGRSTSRTPVASNPFSVGHSHGGFRGFLGRR